MAKGPSSTAWWNPGALSSKALKDVCGLHFASKLMIGGRQGARQPGQSPQSAKGSLQGANRRHTNFGLQASQNLGERTTRTVECSGEERGRQRMN